MKKLMILAFALMLAALAALPALAELPAVATPEPGLTEAALSEATAAPGATVAADAPAEPFTWQYLGTIAGTAAATLLIVQFLKAPVDKLWKIPTRVLVYAISLTIMLVATAFNGGLTAEGVLLDVLNAFISAMTAMGAYEQMYAIVEARRKLEAAK